MKPRATFFTAVFSIYAFVIFVAVMILIFPLVIISSFFGKVRGGNMIYELCRIWADSVLFFWGIRHRNLFEFPEHEGPTVFVFNHISYLEIPLLMKALRRRHIRVLGKAEMKRMPVFGYIYGKAVVAVDRSCDAARAASVAELKKVLKKNISIVLFPEGTFNLTGKPMLPFFKGAFRLAVDMQVPVQPVLFLDTFRLMHYSSIFSLRPGRSRAVFLKPVLPGSDAEMLRDEVFQNMDRTLRRLKADWITDYAA